MKQRLTARVVLEFDFTDNLERLNECRANEGEPPLAADEVRGFVADELAGLDLNDHFCADTNLEVMVDEESSQASGEPHPHGMPTSNA